MDYINDININEAVVHILDKNADEPILNEFKLELNEDIYKFIYKHIDKCLNDDELKYAKFNSETNTIKEITQYYLNGISSDLKEISKQLAKGFFGIIKSNAMIPSCDLIIASIVTDQGPMIAILKMDYVKNFTHSVEVIDGEIGIGIVQQIAGLPGSGQKIQKAAFVKPIREDDTYNLMILDKQKKTKEEEEYGADYFVNSFLGCTVIENERDLTKDFKAATERWVRKTYSDDASRVEQIRSTIRGKLKEEERINIRELSGELFSEVPAVKEDFQEFIEKAIAGQEVFVDKTWVENKLKRIKIKIDRGIDLSIDSESYTDTNRFEIKKNSDGSINLVIKNVMNYIEK